MVTRLGGAELGQSAAHQLAHSCHEVRMNLPYMAIGNQELNALPPLGKTLICWRCGKRHRVRFGEQVLEDGSREPSPTLAFMHCGGKTYLCGVQGKAWRPRS